MAVQQYTVKSPERWDNVAYKAYGDPDKIEPIVEANPEVLITAIIPAGTILDIPIFEEEDVETPAELLPPWMQQ